MKNSQQYVCKHILTKNVLTGTQGRRPALIDAPDCITELE